MQNYDLCLKLESQRIVADFLGEQRGFRLSSDSLSTQSDDSITRLKRGTSGEECTWDGPEDSEVCPRPFLIYGHIHTHQTFG